jgi:hypothetical protein
MIDCACAPATAVLPCRGNQQQGCLVQHRVPGSVCGLSLLPAAVPEEVLPEKEAAVKDRRCCEAQSELQLGAGVVCVAVCDSGIRVGDLGPDRLTFSGGRWLALCRVESCVQRRCILVPDHGHACSCLLALCAACGRGLQHC